MLGLSSNENALKQHLNGDKITVEKKVSGNPLLDFLKEEKHVNEPEPVHKTDSHDSTENPSSTQRNEPQNTGNQQKPADAPPADQPPPFQKDINYKRYAERIIKMWDQAASRLLKWLAKDENRKRWQLSDEDVADIMEWMPDVAERYKLTVDNPVIGLMITVGLIYGPKVWDAVEMRQLKTKIEEQEEQIRYWKKQAGINPDEPAHHEEHATDENLRNMRENLSRMKKNKTATSNIQEVEVIVEDEPTDEVIIEDQPAPKSNGKVKQPSKEFKEEFDLKSQMEREFHTEMNVETNNSTANSGKKSTVEKNLNGSERKINAVEDKNIHDDGVYVPVPDRPGFALDPDPDEGSAIEVYTPLKEDKKGRETEIVRCRMTKQLFERFKGSNKWFINNDAKNRYHYLVKLQEQGKQPKEGFPHWWQSG